MDLIGIVLSAGTEEEEILVRSACGRVKVESNDFPKGFDGWVANVGLRFKWVLRKQRACWGMVNNFWLATTGTLLENDRDAANADLWGYKERVFTKAELLTV